MLTGDSLELEFKAAPWSRDDTSLTLSADGEATFGQHDFEMAEGQWTTFKTTLTGTGRVVITLTPGRRFFLDEVVVRKKPDAAAIRDIELNVSDSPGAADCYDLQGRRVALPAKGIYVQGGRKVVR